MRSHPPTAAGVLTAVLAMSVQAAQVEVANDLDTVRANETIEVKPID